MQETDFLKMLEDILDIDDFKLCNDLTMSTRLTDLEEWDSLSMLMFQSKALQYKGEKIDPLKIKAAEEVHDLFDLLK